LSEKCEVTIAQLEAEKTKLVGRMEKDFDATLKDRLAAVNKDLANGL
jgi:hypothetical protein